MSYQFMSSNPRPSDMNELNDCAVRATSIATELDYKAVHSVFAKHGRKPRKGTYIATMMAVAKELNKDSTFISYLGTRSCASYAPTLSKFIKDNPTGHWVICRRNHAFAVKDGVVYDAHKSQAGSRCRVLYAIKVK